MLCKVVYKDIFQRSARALKIIYLQVFSKSFFFLQGMFWNLEVITKLSNKLNRPNKANKPFKSNKSNTLTIPSQPSLHFWSPGAKNRRFTRWMILSLKRKCSSFLPWASSNRIQLSISIRKRARSAPGENSNTHTGLQQPKARPRSTSSSESYLGWSMAKSNTSAR